MKYRVPFIKPVFPPADHVAADYRDILASRWFTNFGPCERRFAAKIASYIGDGYAAATFSSATAALMASLHALLGKGDGTRYVVMPSFTFAAGADAVEWCGYRPVFADIEGEGLQMDVASVRSVLADEQYRGNIAGILFCNAFGVGTTNIEAWETLAESAAVPLVVDSAAGFGSLYAPGKKVGTAGRCEIFSFHATKPFAIGEGGAVVSQDQALIRSLMSIQNFGFDGRSATDRGFNGKLQELNAAIGLRQFERFDERIRTRQAAFARYRSELDARRFAFQRNAERASLCFATVIVRDQPDRDMYLSRLHDAGVDAKVYYSPSLHRQPYFSDAERSATLETTERVEASVLSLPIHEDTATDDVDTIVATLNR